MATLFLLNPNFNDTRISTNDKFYCPHCARMEGVLKYYPHLKDVIKIEYVDFQRPRQRIIDLIGEKNQGCPVLIIDKMELKKNDVDLESFKMSGDYIFANTTEIITKYLAQKYKIGFPHP